MRKAGNQVRITAQLIDARSDTHLWSATYDRHARRHLRDAGRDRRRRRRATEVETARRRRRRLRPPTRKPTRSTCRPGSLTRQRTKEGYEQALALFKQALAIDPNYAAAWDGLARVYINQTVDSQRPLDEGLRLAREAVGKALEIDPEFALADARLGLRRPCLRRKPRGGVTALRACARTRSQKTDIIANAATMLLKAWAGSTRPIPWRSTWSHGTR